MRRFILLTALCFPSMALSNAMMPPELECIDCTTRCMICCGAEPEQTDSYSCMHCYHRLLTKKVPCDLEAKCLQTDACQTRTDESAPIYAFPKDLPPITKDDKDPEEWAKKYCRKDPPRRYIKGGTPARSFLNPDAPQKPVGDENAAQKPSNSFDDGASPDNNKAMPKSNTLLQATPDKDPAEKAPSKALNAPSPTSDTAK